MTSISPEAVQAAPAPGFSDVQAQSQSAFRALLEAMSRPGTVVPINGPSAPPNGLAPAAAAVCLTLMDLDTPLWLEPNLRTPEIEDYLRFHCGCPLVVDPAGAAFALLSGWSGRVSLESFNPGQPDYPDRSTTVVIQVEALRPGRGVLLEGPGMKAPARLLASGLSDGFWADFKANRELFPQGVDVILAAPRELAGLPRSVRVKE